jgi:hypothetical protein
MKDGSLYAVGDTCYLEILHHLKIVRGQGLAVERLRTDL